MRFRFTIRDLLWLTLVVALGLGWWLDHRRNTGSIEPFPAYHPHLILNFGQADLSPEEREKLGIEQVNDVQQSHAPD